MGGLALPGGVRQWGWVFSEAVQGSEEREVATHETFRELRR